MRAMFNNPKGCNMEPNEAKRFTALVAETRTAQTYPPLESVTRPTVETAAAAYYLNRRPQTMRIHACMETGPIRPLRINGRLHWRTDDLRKLLGVVV